MNSNMVTLLFLCFSLCSSLLVAGCMTTPQNGQTFNGSTIEAYMYSGWTQTPGAQIEVQVLDNASDDPTDDHKWITLATTNASSSFPLSDATGTLWYSWSVKAGSTPRRWPPGGLQRVRVRSAGVPLTTFDEDYSACFWPKIKTGKGFLLAGNECASPYKFATLVSTTPNPADLNPPQYLSFGIYKSTNDENDERTDEYYKRIGAPATLADFKRVYGFANIFAPLTDEVHFAPLTDEVQVAATYFNYSDLGLGREMHCKAYSAGRALVGRACYVTNYDGVGGPIPSFPADPHKALSDAINHTHAVATVAMVYDPRPGKQKVQFMVFDGQGKRSTTAQLDSKGSNGSNASVPRNCLVCHGGTYDPASQEVKNAHFLPFDVFRFQYTNDLGIDNPAYTYSAQAENFRRLNEHVYYAGATLEIREMIDAMYGGLGNVSKAGIPAREYVPDSWDQAGKAKVYNAVVKPYCRTCHIAREENSGLIWETYQHFETYVKAERVKQLVCETYEMPNAEQTLKNFWKSSARAHLAGAFPEKIQGRCHPEN